MLSENAPSENVPSFSVEAVKCSIDNTCEIESKLKVFYRMENIMRLKGSCPSRLYCENGKYLAVGRSSDLAFICLSSHKVLALIDFEGAEPTFVCFSPNLPFWRRIPLILFI